MVSGMSYASYTIADKMVAMMQKENNSGGCISFFLLKTQHE
jgi:hypothetical protein